MNITNHNDALSPEGIRIGGDMESVSVNMSELLDRLNLLSVVTMKRVQSSVVFELENTIFTKWVPAFDTTQLCSNVDLQSESNLNDLEREIMLALLAAPQQIVFPSFDEFISALNIRINIVRAAQKTHLAFKTSEAERPVDYWQYDEEFGFTVKPGKSIITALEKATQPDLSGNLYSFSCYRASEYVLLLAIAKELEKTNADLYKKLQSCFEYRAIKSGRFHDTFLTEYGSFEAPIPLRYYIPGGRVWFKNPDSRSSDIAGYEGSWVFYLGNGKFSNFWKRDEPFTLKTKCIEIFHWRNAVFIDQDGEARIDDALVDLKVAETLKNDDEAESIFQNMMRYRDPVGHFNGGGCIDISREYSRTVYPETSTITL